MEGGRNGDGLLGQSERVHMRDKSSMFHQDLLSPLGVEVKNKEMPTRFAIELKMIMGAGIELGGMQVVVKICRVVNLLP